MPDGTAQVAVTMPDGTIATPGSVGSAPVAPASAATLGHTVITPQEAEALESRAAAKARRATEEEWKLKLAEETSTRDAELQKYRDAEQARKDLELTEIDRERKARETADQQAAATAAEAQQLRDELDVTRKRAHVSTLIAASGTRIPSRYHPDVYAACLPLEAINPETVEAALVEAKAAWETDLVSYGPRPEPTPATAPPRSVGTPTAPPAQQPAVSQSEAEKAEMVKGLTLAYMAGDMEAGNKLDAIYAGKR